MHRKCQFHALKKSRKPAIFKAARSADSQAVLKNLQTESGSLAATMQQD
jgi:hypothetical protein